MAKMLWGMESTGVVRCTLSCDVFFLCLIISIPLTLLNMRLGMKPEMLQNLTGKNQIPCEIPEQCCLAWLLVAGGILSLGHSTMTSSITSPLAIGRKFPEAKAPLQLMPRLPLMLLLMLPGPTPCTAQIFLPVTRSQLPAMMALKAAWGAFDGAESWVATRPCNEWEGITCLKHGQVTQIALSLSRVSGRIPPAIANVSTLNFVDLSFNSLVGVIPESVGLLRGLQTLYLQGNRLTGGVPAVLGSLPMLEYVDLSFNALGGGIPETLGQARGLKEIRLVRNSLTGVLPPSLASLNALQVLDLSNNSLAGDIPSSYSRGLASLAQLVLANNFLTGTLTSLPSVRVTFRTPVLDVSGNFFYGTPHARLGGVLKCVPSSGLSLNTQALVGGNCLVSSANCLLPRATAGSGGGGKGLRPQQTVLSCWRFCRTVQGTPATQCRGFGVCLRTPAATAAGTPSVRCSCANGYTTQGVRGGLYCVKALPSPPPLPRQSPPPPVNRISPRGP